MLITFFRNVLRAAACVLALSSVGCINWQKAQDQFCSDSLNPNCSSSLLGGDAGQGPPAARPIWPLSTGTVTSQRPTLQWALPNGATHPMVEFCTSRDCAIVMTALAPDGTGLAARPSQPLAPGWYWWRIKTTLSTGTSYSPVWQFRVPPSSAAVDTSFGSTLDLNGDGFSEVAIGASCAPLNDGGCGEGRVYIYSGSKLSFGTGSPQVLTGESANSQFGLSLASAGDVNGDGYPDLVVGAPRADALGAPGVGRVYIYFGGPSGIVSPPWTIDGPDGNASDFGQSVAGIGDVDHDGYADIAVGTPSAVVDGVSGAGRVHLYRGGPSKMTEMTPIDSPDGRSGFGNSVAGAGDVDGNTYSDVIIGEPFKSNNTPGHGGFYVYFGSKTGFTKDHRSDDSNNAANSSGSSDDYGWVVAGNADVNGDGYGDFAVGCNACTPIYGSTTYDSAGYANWYQGSPNPDFSLVHGLPGPQSTNQHYAVSMVLGDVDGDGRSDAVIGSEFEAQARYFAGGSSGLSSTSINLAPAGAHYGYGAGVGMADVDGDSRPEIFVGLPDTGQVYVYKGPITTPSPAPLLILNCPDPGTSTGFGSAISGK